MNHTYDLGGGWLPEIEEKLRHVLDVGAKRVKKGKRAVAVFDFDHTVIFGDIGASLAHYLSENLLYRYDLEAFWELVDPEKKELDRRRLVEELLDSDDPRTHPEYANYLDYSLNLYEEKTEHDGKAAAIAWAIQLHTGISEFDMASISEKVIRTEMQRQVRLDSKVPNFLDNVKSSPGIRPYLEMALTIQALEQVGFEVWIVSATNFWSVKTFASYFGIKEERVLGNRVEVSDSGLLTQRTLDPVLYGKGKLKAIKKWIQERPLVVFGDSMTDFDMLKYAKELSVLIDYQEPQILKAAHKYKWAIQPYNQLHLIESLDEIPCKERLFDPYDAPPLSEEELQSIHLERR